MSQVTFSERMANAASCYMLDQEKDPWDLGQKIDAAVAEFELFMQSDGPAAMSLLRASKKSIEFGYSAMSEDKSFGGKSFQPQRGICKLSSKGLILTTRVLGLTSSMPLFLLADFPVGPRQAVESMMFGESKIKPEEFMPFLKAKLQEIIDDAPRPPDTMG